MAPINSSVRHTHQIGDAGNSSSWTSSLTCQKHNSGLVELRTWASLGWAARWPLLHQASLEALHQIRPFSVLLDPVTVMPSRRSRRTLSLVAHRSPWQGLMVFCALSTQEM